MASVIRTDSSTDLSTHLLRGLVFKTKDKYMFALTNKPEMGARLYSSIIELASEPERGTDSMQVIQHLAGVLVETYLVFDCPDQAMEASFQKLSDLLGCEPMAGDLSPSALPPAHIIDFETERGRHAARGLFEEWMDCVFEFHDLILVIVHNIIVSWEDDGQGRAETFRLLIESVMCCMAFEIAAQELCDIVIEKKVSRDGWCLADCVSALSAVAGRRLALTLDMDSCMIFDGAAIPENLDKVVYVMTQEAIRLGVPAGSDWRLGLAANDVPVSAPLDLIYGTEPYCESFFKAINLNGSYEQAICCAKAAGRMVAVASGGALPEMEPVIAKPLAMAAITETYKSICMNPNRISL